jgi:hypothetical protein
MSREIDALVAEHVMGWTVNRSDGRHWHTVAPAAGADNPHLLVGMDCCEDKYCGCFMPSRRIESAWRVVEKMREREWSVMVDSTGFPDEEWRCLMWQGERERWVPADAATAPMAICLAALKANGIEVSAA